MRNSQIEASRSYQLDENGCAPLPKVGEIIHLNHGGVTMAYEIVSVESATEYTVKAVSSAECVPVKSEIR